MLKQEGKESKGINNNRRLAGLVFVASILLIGLRTLPAQEYPADNWHSVVIPKTGGHGMPEAIISYAGKILYGDEIFYSKNDDEPLRLDLILRSIDDPANVEETAQIFGTVLRLDGSIPRCDLNEIDIECLAEYHGKLLVGILAYDPIVPFSEDGTNDTYRRRVYISSSVDNGYLISNVYDDIDLAGSRLLNLDLICPLPPHTEWSPGMESPTHIEVYVRTAESEENMEFATWIGPYDASTNIDIPSGHYCVQYKIEMGTTDEVLTPVVQKIELRKIGGGVVFSDDAWTNTNDYDEAHNVSGTLSKGELVLANKALPSVPGSNDQPQVKFSYFFQAPAKDRPPKWCFSVDDPKNPNDDYRSFNESLWPYLGVISMDVFNGKLHMNIGTYLGPMHTLSAGEFVSYDYGNGLIRTEAKQYSAIEKDWWSEGNGCLRIVDNLLIDNGVDTKGDVIGETPMWVQLYHVTAGDGQWHVGLTPYELGLHLWDVNAYAGKLIISRNGGVFYRDMPEDMSGHYDGASYNPDTWILLEGTQHNPQCYGLAQSYLNIYRGYLVVYFHDIWNDAGQWNRIRKILTYTYDPGADMITLVSEIDFLNTVLQGADHGTFPTAWFQHNGRLIVWNRRNGQGTDDAGFSDAPELQPYTPRLDMVYPADYWASRLYYTDPIVQPPPSGPQSNGENGFPITYSLSQNFPNPLTKTCVINYQLPKDNLVNLKIYNILGQDVRTLVNEQKQPGYYSVTWDGRDDAGKQVASGVYFLNLETRDFVQTKKMTVIR